MEIEIDKKIAHQETIKKFIEWTLTKLFKNDQKILKDLHLEISYVPEKNSLYASCATLEQNKDPRTFEIEIYRKLGLYEKIRIIAHELVHIKQYANNELVTKSAKVKYPFIWKSKKYDNSLDYWDRPWEIEAHGYEKGLIIQFITQEYKRTPRWWRDTL